MSENVSQRHANRQALVQFLYMIEMNPPEEMTDSIRMFFESREHPRVWYGYAEELLAGILDELDSIDARIGELAKNWEFGRIARTDLAILRLGIYEILHREDVPPVVVIDEAVELSREFSTEKSNTFINGLLDRIMQEVERPNRERLF